MNRGKVFCSSDIGSQQVKIIVQKAAAIIVCFIALRHFDENPVVISVLVTLLLSFVLFIGVERIKVYRDRFVLYSVFTYVNWLRKRQFYFDQIEEVYYPVEFEVGNLSWKQQYLNRIDSRRKFYVLFKDGSSELVSTTIPIGHLKITFMKIQHLVSSYR